ncbi:F-box/kelch-repeat protein At3g06240-like [Arachis stenosperma]|uniref:F-box/kelch-repeat protein At3g06240-like n=1 Tax=Arachis stenosperma TaxID=217475 RepID=UPI0025AD42C3|nr:F-box/kelch-repeat protein At3g06240-like [Arachis stenosperma]
MDEKMKLKHTGNKPKQQSSMKKKQQQNENHKSKSIHDILALELIHRILLRVPVKDLDRLKCVSKLWNTLISDPDFAKSHLHLSAAPTHVCLFISDRSNAFSVDIDAVFHRHTALKEDKNGQEHFDCLSLRTNSWTNLDFALSKPLDTSNWQSCGYLLEWRYSLGDF